MADRRVRDLPRARRRQCVATDGGHDGDRRGPGDEAERRTARRRTEHEGDVRSDVEHGAVATCLPAPSGNPTVEEVRRGCHQKEEERGRSSVGPVGRPGERGRERRGRGEPRDAECVGRSRHYRFAPSVTRIGRRRRSRRRST